MVRHTLKILRLTILGHYALKGLRLTKFMLTLELAGNATRMKVASHMVDIFLKKPIDSKPIIETWL